MIDNILAGGVDMTIDEMYMQLSEEDKERVNLFVEQLKEARRIHVLSSDPQE